MVAGFGKIAYPQFYERTKKNLRRDIFLLGRRRLPDRKRGFYGPHIDENVGNISALRASDSTCKLLNSKINIKPTATCARNGRSRLARIRGLIRPANIDLVDCVNLRICALSIATRLMKYNLEVSLT